MKLCDRLVVPSFKVFRDLVNLKQGLARYKTKHHVLNLTLTNCRLAVD
jgi:hypothetical protein